MGKFPDLHMQEWQTAMRICKQIRPTKQTTLSFSNMNDTEREQLFLNTR